MLTETGYLGGMAVYVIAALLALLLFNLWLLRGRGPVLRLLLTLPLGAALLTPAYTKPGADSMAPALIVSAFQWFSQGPESAQHALRPLGMFCAIAFALALCLALVLLAYRRIRTGGNDG